MALFNSKFKCSNGQKPCGKINTTCIPEARICCNVLDYNPSDLAIQYDTFSCPSGFHCEGKAEGTPQCCQDGYFACIDVFKRDLYWRQNRWRQNRWSQDRWIQQPNTNGLSVCCQTEQLCFGPSQTSGPPICQNFPKVGAVEEAGDADLSVSSTSLFVVLVSFGGIDRFAQFD